MQKLLIMILLSKTATITHQDAVVSFDLSDMLPQGVYQILLSAWTYLFRRILIFIMN